MDIAEPTSTPPSFSYKLESGLTWKSLFVLIFASLTVTALSTYLLLATPPGYGLVAQAGAPAATYIIIILLSELASLASVKITRQEMFIIFSLASVSVSGPFLTFIFYAYFRVHPVTLSTIDGATGQPFSSLIPTWYSPPAGILDLRTFIHPYWLPVISVFAISFALRIIAEIALGFIMAQLTIAIEKLPFPLAPVASETVITIGERDPGRMRVFSMSAVVSAGLVLFLFSGALPIPGILPWWVPTIELSDYVSRVLPGSTFGINLNPLDYLIGFLLPKNVVIAMVITSMAVWILGNYLALQLPFDAFLEWKNDYILGMPTSVTWFRAVLWMWQSFMVGAALGIVASRLIRGRKEFVAAFRSLRKIGEAEESGLPRLWILISMFLIGSFGSVALVYYLVPQFPLWILIVIGVVWPFVFAVVSSRSVALTGYAFSLPYLREMVILASGVGGVDVWFAPFYVPTGEAAGFTSTIKVAYLTGTKPVSYFKAYAIIMPFAWLASFLWVSLFWNMSYIPSALYPATISFWTTQTVQQLMIVTKAPRIFKPTLIVAGGATMLVLEGLSIFFPSISSIAAFNGILMTPIGSSSLIIGYLLGNVLFKKILGENSWARYRSLIVAGAYAGGGVTIALGAAMTMIVKAVWPLPF